MAIKEFTIYGLGTKSATTLIDFPEQLIPLRKGERISTEGLVKLSTRSEKRPFLPNEFVINNEKGVIETLKETIHGVVIKTTYEVIGNNLLNLNAITYEKINPLSAHYTSILDDIKKNPI